MTIQLTAFVVAVIGLLVYALGSGKIAEIGRITFGRGGTSVLRH